VVIVVAWFKGYCFVVEVKIQLTNFKPLT